MKTYITIIALFISLIGFSQATISGKITDNKNKPLSGVNVFVDGTYDGATTNESGDFSFETTTTGNQILVISYLTFDTQNFPIVIETYQSQTIKLKSSVNSLDAVYISAGTFEAGDKARVSVLKPLDIVTTAGSNADIVAALQTLPGTQTVGESGRLFVRGGEADETQTFVDGVRVAQPYGATSQNLPTRGRFSPFLFSGISFSTGGYSAEYGDALSSVLLLNTTEVPDEEKTDVSFMTVGLGLSNTQKWNKSSLSVNTAYIDLAPYQAAIPQDVHFNRAFQSLSGETVYRYKFNAGMLKMYAAFDASRFDLDQESINAPYKTRIDLHNNNFYFNTSYKGRFGNNWQLIAGMSYGYGNNKIGIDTDKLNNTENASHLKVKLKKSFSDRVKLSFGADYFITKFDEDFNKTFESGYNSNIAAVYTEADIFFSKEFAAKVGVRVSNNDLLKETAISPRASLAYKVSKNGQFALAYGMFEQAPKQDYLKYSDDFENEKASHYILNYQYSHEKRTFRAEVYYKDYSDLVKFDTETAQFDSQYNNKGFGFAKGLDVFWRDGKTIKNMEYWVSYSYIDSKRDYKNYVSEVTPSFIAKQNISLVTKYWINDWKSQIGFSHSFNSGRPYQNPNEAQFMNSKTKTYNNLSFNWAYLLSQQKILYFSISNMLGTKNVYGYEYANTQNANGIYDRRAITPSADRFFFVGFFWTISDNKKDNQLNNL
ncbi:TonB-dependent receptor [Flavobacterium sp.]|uniref:TonB-dependent receptor n=1 Tax=Flavobacterium sp. TaxID=239 RepID=UPI00262069BB|nr:TonB-dependent receptor [Flavobacterium sp.]